MSTSNTNAAIQFTKGIDENVVPEIRVTRNKDGKKDTATFVLNQPDVLKDETTNKIDSMTMIYSNGTLITKKVNIITFSNNKNMIEAIYTWNTSAEFKVFIGFAQDYANRYGLNYSNQ